MCINTLHGIATAVPVGFRFTEWLTVTEENLILRRCAFWATLAGLPDTENRETVTISLVAANRLDVTSMRWLMEKSRTGSI
jgi:hypothetical protein